MAGIDCAVILLAFKQIDFDTIIVSYKFYVLSASLSMMGFKDVHYDVWILGGSIYKIYDGLIMNIL